MLINKILEKFNKPSVTKIDNLIGEDILFKVKNGLGKLTMKRRVKIEKVIFHIKRFI